METPVHTEIDRIAQHCTTAPQYRAWASPLHQIATDLEHVIALVTLDDVIAAAPAWLDERTDLKPKVRDDYARRIHNFKRKMREEEA